MPALTTPLTEPLAKKIVAAINKGTYPPIAAQAHGVDAATLARWLRTGRAKKAKNPYRSFALRVDKATAQARAKAEAKAWEKNPLAWLKHHPDLTHQAAPTWAGPTDDGPTTAEDHQKLLAAILHALTPYPDARQAVANALQETEKHENEAPGQPENA